MPTWDAESLELKPAAMYAVLWCGCADDAWFYGFALQRDRGGRIHVIDSDSDGACEADPN